MEKELYWSKFADDFEEKNNYVVGDDMAIILNEVRQQKDLKIILELGCGNGTYSKILSEEANQLTATDFSDEMVEAATNRLVNFDNITIEKADCFNLHYEASSFDTIFMANLLHIIPDPDKAIAECKRVLRKDGRLIIVSFTAEGMTFINKLLMIIRYLKTYGRPSPFAQNLTISTTEEILVKNGFQPTQSKLLGKNMKAIFVTCCC